MIKVTVTDPKALTRVRNIFRKRLPRMLVDGDTILQDLVDETTLKLREIILIKDRSSFVRRLAAISEEWVQRKRRKGWILHQLAARGTYGNSIHWIGSKGEYSIQVPRQTYPGTKITFAQLRDYLEYGTRDFPARPHWRPAQQYIREEFPKRMQEMIKRV